MSIKTNKASSSQTIDGVVRANKARTLSGHPKKAAQAVHRGVQRSHTLMRAAVQKPKDIASRAESPKAKLNTGQALDIARVSRSKSFAKSTKVKRFGSFSPAATPTPAKAKRTAAPAQAAQVASSRVKPVPSMVTSVSHQQLERLLDQALFRADAHKKASRARSGFGGRVGLASRKSKILAAGLAAVLIVAVASIFAWQNVPQVAVEVASMRSDVQATVPEYSPAGFSFQGPIAVAGNSVSMKFKSNADPARTYTISQQSSDWDSESLLANFVQTKGVDYQTTQVKGNTVYIWNDNKDATWVNNGVWYTVSDQAGLSSDQLLKLIESL